MGETCFWGRHVFGAQKQPSSFNLLKECFSVLFLLYSLCAFQNHRKEPLEK